MSLLSHYTSILDATSVLKLKEKNIKTVVDFLFETPEVICNITKIHFQDVLEMRKKLIEAFRRKPLNAAELYLEMKSHYCCFPSGIKNIDELIGGLETGRIYELCGLSGSGKTQICLSFTSHMSLLGKRVNFIDTKNDFSASRIHLMLRQKGIQDKDVLDCMERVKVMNVKSLRELVDVLHWQKKLFSFYHTPLIIIDCVSTCFFSSIGSDTNSGFAFLNHIASLMKYIATVHHSIIVVTNLATKYFGSVSEDTSVGKSIKPCLGAYWQHVSNIRLAIRKETDSISSVSVERNDHSIERGTCQIDLSALLCS